MSNVTCTSCNQRKKEENFSSSSLKSGSPVCAGCDVKSLMMRMETLRRNVIDINKQQQAVITATKKVEETVSPKPSRTTAHSRLKGLLMS